jgi:BRCA1 C Terminus (BRCT) domain
MSRSILCGGKVGRQGDQPLKLRLKHFENGRFAMGLLDWLFGKRPQITAPPEDERLPPLPYHKPTFVPSPRPELTLTVTITQNATRQTDGPVLRMMTAPQGIWPTPVDLKNHRCIIDYDSRIAGQYRRSITMHKLRQSEVTPIIDATSDHKGSDGAFRLNRVRWIITPDGEAHEPLAYFERFFGVRCALVDTARSVEPTAENTRLSAMAFAFTGELDVISRAKVRDIIEAAGGQVVGTINDKTTHLVVGHTTISQRKIAAAQKRSIPILDEAAFLKIINP